MGSREIGKLLVNSGYEAEDKKLLQDAMTRASETLNGCDVSERFRTMFIEHAAETY